MRNFGVVRHKIRQGWFHKIIQPRIINSHTSDKVIPEFNRRKFAPLSVGSHIFNISTFLYVSQIIFFSTSQTA